MRIQDISKMSLRILALVGVSTLILLVSAPAQAATGVAVPTSGVETTGIIHVVQKVINDNSGTMVPSDFTLNLKHWGADVVGSPFKGTEGVGTTFVLAPGTYVAMQSIVDGYLGTWSGPEIDNGFIDLQAGQEITITRTLDDYGVAPAVVVETSSTEEGGTLPSTASPWLNLFGAGLVMSAAGFLTLLTLNHFGKPTNDRLHTH